MTDRDLIVEVCQEYADRARKWAAPEVADAHTEYTRDCVAKEAAIRRMLDENEKMRAALVRISDPPKFYGENHDSVALTYCIEQSRNVLRATIGHTPVNHAALADAPVEGEVSEEEVERVASALRFEFERRSDPARDAWTRVALAAIRLGARVGGGR